MRLSVIIPTRNRVRSLCLTLRALEDQTISKNEFEVIVVDNGSDSVSRRQLQAHNPAYRCTVLEKPHKGLAAARNFGASHAKGDILHFLDDDVICAPGTLDQHIRAHQNGAGQMVVVGSLPFAEHLAPSPFLWYLEKRGHYDVFRSPKGKYPGGKPPLPPLNGNASIPRELFLRIGSYDETFTRYGGEDLELGYRLVKAGIPFVYHPAAIGYHNHTKNFSAFCADMEKAGESLIRIYRKYPEIRSIKKIDILADPITKLSGKKWIVKIVLSASLSFPGVLTIPRLMTRKYASRYAFRYLLFPFFYWVSQYHYAIGMKKGLVQGK
jgi:GT2 family glycosyltransferase